MRDVKLYLSALVLAGLAGLPLAAQQPSPNPSPSTPQSTPSEPNPASQQPQTAPSEPTPQSAPSAQPGDTVPSTANSPEASNNELRPIQGELEKKLDAKSAKAGDEVVVKTTEKATIGDGVVIPKGSKIVGQVVDAQPVGGENKNSKVTVLFNQAQLKDGQSLPIKSVIQSLAPASGADNNASPYGGTASMPSSAPVGGGASASSPSGAPMGGNASTQPQSNPGATPATAPTMGAGNNAPAANAAPVAGTVVAQQGNVAIRTTQIPGVLIASSVNGQPFSNASGAILGAQQNVHLDGGTHVVLAIADAGSKGSNTK